MLYNVHKSDFETIYNSFGETVQRFKLAEECKEYLDEIDLTSDRSNGEIADIIVVALQLYFANPSIQKEVEVKTIRTLERIRTGYYKTNPLYREVK